MSLKSTPRTWVASEVVTAAMMNTEIRDALVGLQAAWTSFTPTWSAVTTAPTIGNGTITGSYLLVGKTILFQIRILMGSTTTYGSGQWTLTLPVAPLSAARIQYPASLFDFGTGDRPGCGTWESGNNRMILHTDPTTAGAALRAVTNTVPHTWAVSDEFVIWGTYESA